VGEKNSENFTAANIK